MATEREILLEAALFEIEGIADNAIAPYDDSAAAKLDRILQVIWGAGEKTGPVAKAMLEIHDEQGPH